MDPGTVALIKEFVTLYGPLGFGWVLAVYLLRHVLRTHAENIRAMLKLADSVASLEKWVREALSR